MSYGADEIYTRWSWDSLTQWKSLQRTTGERLFTEDGKPSPYTERVLKFLKEYQAHFERTRAFCTRQASGPTSTAISSTSTSGATLPVSRVAGNGSVLMYGARR